MANQLDLHMHSIISNDGEYTPSQLMQLCQQHGLKTVALADHNSVRGIAEAQRSANELGLEFIRAIELDCQFEGVNLHLLGYGIDPALSKFEKNEMIAEAALADQRNQNNTLLEPYRKNGKRSDNPYVNFYWDFCSQGKPAYVPIQFMGLNEAIQLIRKARGLAVLAHPGINIGQNQKILEGIVACGIDGMEVYSSYHDENMVAFYKEQAEKFHLLKTIGSDFHGKTKPAIKLGSMNCYEEIDIYHQFNRKLSEMAK